MFTLIVALELHKPGKSPVTVYTVLTEGLTAMLDVFAAPGLQVNVLAIPELVSVAVLPKHMAVGVMAAEIMFGRNMPSIPK